MLRRGLLRATALALVFSAVPAQAQEIISIDNGETVTIASPWDISGDVLRIGDTGTGTLTIGPGGTVSSLDAYLGYNVDGNGTVTVTGAGSIWTNSGDLAVGQFGTGTLFIEDGGTVTSTAGILGVIVGSTGTVTVAGEDSSWTNSGDLAVGGLGAGTLAIADGATVSSTKGHLGLTASGIGTATISGEGSIWTSSQLFVGDAGTGTLVIKAGATVSGDFGAIGYKIDGDGTATVSGAGSTWRNTGDLAVGQFGTGALFIEDGGKVANAAGVVGVAGGTGTVTVSGEDSVWANSSDLVVGGAGTGTLTVTDGGAVSSATGQLGMGGLGIGAATISGEDSIWTNSGDLRVGGAGTGTLTITDGGAVTSAFGVLGYDLGGDGTITVSGAGSTWTNSGDLAIGQFSTGTLIIEDGGKVANAAGVVGVAGGTGTVTVSGEDSVWTNSSDLVVGGTSTLTVTNGGTVFSATGRVGSVGGGKATISGEASSWTTSFELFVGHVGTGTLAIEEGGAVASATGILGDDAGSHGKATVIGENSSWTNSGLLTVGDGGTGTLTIGDSGTVSSGVGVVGRESGSDGTVTVFGAGSTWTIGGDLRLGYVGIGKLTIGDGGTVTSSTSVLGSDTSGVGTLALAGADGARGVLETAYLTTGGGTADFIFDGGILRATRDEADFLRNFDAGEVTIAADGAFIDSNGYDIGIATDLQGTGGLTKTGAGTLTLTGTNTYIAGTSIVGGSLLVEGSLGGNITVAAGAMLGGSGTLGGMATVANGGTVSPGSSPGALTVGSLALNEGSILDYELGPAGVVGGGVNDLIEVTGNLTLDGVLNVTAEPAFGNGVYTLIDYGTLVSDNGLALGTMPDGYSYVLDSGTGTDSTVRLAVSGAAAGDNQYWDGPNMAPGGTPFGRGGNGTWSADPGNTNWTNAFGDVNASWGGNFAVFGGFAGTVIVNGPIDFAGMQFLTDGYAIRAGLSGELVTGAASNIRVGSGIGATILAPITGAGGLVKLEAGELTLTGVNSYGGGTTISGGTLSIVGGDALPDGSTVSLADAAATRLVVRESETIGGLSGGGTVGIAAGQTLTVGAGGSSNTFAGAITRDGSLTKIGAGTLTLTGTSAYQGNTTVNAGTLAIAAGGKVSSATGVIGDNGDSSGTVTVSGEASSWTNTGSLAVGSAGTGTLVIAAGSMVSNDTGFLGVSFGGEGSVTVSGAGSTWTNNGLAVGALGNGTLVIAGGGVVSSAGGVLGSQDSSGGTVTVSGASSTWTNSGAFTVGEFGIGTLTIADGATVRIDTDDGVVGGGTASIAVEAGSTGTLNIGSEVGAIAAAPGTLSADSVTFGDGDGTIDFNHTADDYVFAAGITGAGAIGHYAGTTVLTGDSTGFSGLTTVAGGMLRVNGTLGGDVDVLDGAIFGGTGSAGSVSVADGGILSPGSSPGTLTVASLALNPGSILDYELGPAGGANDLIEVTGNLTLDGVLNVTAEPAFGNGVYTLIDYGTLVSDNELVLGTMPNGYSYTLDSGAGAASAVTLLVAGGAAGEVQFWDGSFTTPGNTPNGRGGDGIWNSLTSNWTNQPGTGNDAWGGNFAVFAGSAGTVTVDGPIDFTGMQFLTDGYAIEAGTGGELVTDIASKIRVGPGLGVAISAPIAGTGGLVKLEDGTLTLSGINSYAGDTTISGGTLEIVGGLVLPDMSLVSLWNAPGTRLLVSESETIGGLSGGGPDGGIVEIGDGQTLTLGTNDGFNTFAGAIIGDGDLTKIGSGQLTLAGDSSTFAGQTTISGGTLTVADVLHGSASVTGGRFVVDGTFGGDIAARAGGVLMGAGTIAGDGDFTDGGVLAGVRGQTLDITGNLLMDGSSVLNAALGTASAVALFDVDGDLTLDGTLNVANAGGFGTGVYRLMNYGGTLADNGLELGSLPTGADPDDLTVQTGVTNQVNLLVEEAGSGDPGDPGPAPEVQLWDGPNTTANGAIDGGSGTWSLGPTNWTRANGDVHDAWDDGFAVFQGAAGAVTVDAAAGAIMASGMQFASDGYRVEGDAITLVGTGDRTLMRVGDGTAAGAGMTATVAAALTGASTLVKDDLGTLILTGANSYTGDTQVRAGTLVGDAVSIRGDIANASTVAFDQAGDASFAGIIVGLGGTNGQMVKRGAGTLTLGGSSSLDWTVEAGSPVSATDRFTGDLSLAAGTGFTFDQIYAGSYAGTISGDGGLAFTGGGTVNLTGDSSAYGGTTQVLTTTLAVNGRLGGSAMVGTGGWLQGTGVIGSGTGSSVTVTGGGTLAPGNSPGTLTINGNLVLDAGSRYEVEVVPGGTGSDLVAVTGTATLNGGAVAHIGMTGTYDPTSTYTILTADGGVTGTFGSVSSDFAFLDPTLGYETNAITLTLERNGIGFGDIGRTRNQIATAAGIESLGLGSDIHDAVVQLDKAAARNAFDRLSGEIHASAITGLIEDSRQVRHAVNDRIRAAFGDVAASHAPVLAYGPNGPVPAPATFDQGLTGWGVAFGSWGSTGSDGNAASLERSTGGLLIGADALIADTWRLGLLAGYSRSSIAASDRFSSASSNNYHLGLYGGTKWGDFAFRAGAAYTWHDIETNRTVGFTGFADNLAAGYDAGTFQAFGELACGFEMERIRFEPFANLAHVNVVTDGFNENGGYAAITGAGSSTDVAFTTLGLRVEHDFMLGTTGVTLKGMLGWQHAFGDTAPTSIHAIAGSDAFTIAGAPIARDSALIEAGLDLNLSPDATFGISYKGQIASGAQNHGFKAQLNIRF